MEDNQKKNLIRFQVANLDFVPDSALPFDRSLVETNPGRFLTLSFAFHALVALAVSTMALPQIEKADFEPIAFDIVSNEASLPPVSQPKSAAEPPKAVKLSEIKKATIAVSSQPVKKSVPFANPAPMVKAAPVPMAPAPAATLDDIVVPGLVETRPLSEADQDPETLFGDEDLAEDFRAVNQANRVAVSKELQKLAGQTQAVEKSGAAALSAAELSAQQEADRLARAVADSSQRRNAVLLAQAQQKKATLAKMAGTQKPESVSSRSHQIRLVQDLRQLPGNPRPTYDSTERLNGDEGEARVLAFVSDQGRLSKMKIIKSTGHPNLDSKTFHTLKRWKFYPGQAGWVEIPIQWSLRGDTQEMPARLRRATQ